MPERAMVYHTNSPVLLTQVPGAETRRSIVARYESPETVVASGWATGVKHLDRRAAIAVAEYGAGTAVLMGCRPQHRGQTHGTYRLLFNAVLDAAAE
jgi:hypothetical protein